MESSLHEVPHPFSILCSSFCKCVRAPASPLSCFIWISFFQLTNVLYPTIYSLTCICLCSCFFRMMGLSSAPSSCVSPLLLSIVVLYCVKAGAHKDTHIQPQVDREPSFQGVSPLCSVICECVTLRVPQVSEWSYRSETDC